MREYQKWNKADDERLLQCVSISKRGGFVDWDSVSKLYPERSKVQLKSRYTNHLKAEASYRKWSTFDSYMLRCYIQIYGTDYLLIQRFFENIELECLVQRV